MATSKIFSITIRTSQQQRQLARKCNTSNRLKRKTKKVKNNNIIIENHSSLDQPLSSRLPIIIKYTDQAQLQPAKNASVSKIQTHPQNTSTTICFNIAYRLINHFSYKSCSLSAAHTTIQSIIELLKCFQFFILQANILFNHYRINFD